MGPVLSPGWQQQQEESLVSVVVIPNVLHWTCCSVLDVSAKLPTHVSARAVCPLMLRLMWSQGWGHACAFLTWSQVILQSPVCSTQVRRDPQLWLPTLTVVAEMPGTCSKILLPGFCLQKFKSTHLGNCLGSRFFKAPEANLLCSHG